MFVGDLNTSHYCDDGDVIVTQTSSVCNCLDRKKKNLMSPIYIFLSSEEFFFVGGCVWEGLVEFITKTLSYRLSIKNYV